MQAFKERYKTDYQYYPTPDTVIENMLLDEDIVGKKIMEPSAGSGNIVRWCKQHGAREVVAYELDDYLRRIVSGECRVLGSDFLKSTKSDAVGCDYIVMNPPFLYADEHINHAFEIAPAGCTIIALCNKSNFSSYDRVGNDRAVFLENVRKYGSKYDMGKVFAQAEHSTHCEIMMVKLFKPREEGSEFDGFLFDEQPEDLGNGEAGLIRYDFIRDVVQRYIFAVQRFEATMNMAKAINDTAIFPLNGIDDDISTYAQRLPVRFACVDPTGKSIEDIDVYTYKRELQKYYWRVIFRMLNLDKIATAKLKEQIDTFIERNADRPFTMHNIYRMLETGYKTNGARMVAAVCEAFDYICSKSAKNSTAGEKWKTNANYMVNRRFIVDGMTDCGSYYRERNVKINAWSKCEIDDVTRALCYLTGADWEEIGRLDWFVRKNPQQWGQWFDWGFFRCKGFLKGTMHFEFKDEKVWQLFNQTAAKGKGWQIGNK